MFVTGESLLGQWPAPGLERLHQLDSALSCDPGEPTAAARSALGELLELDHPVARAVLLQNLSLAHSYGHWGYPHWLLEALSSERMVSLARRLADDPDWLVVGSGVGDEPSVETDPPEGMNRRSSLLRLIAKHDLVATEPALGAWVEALATDPEARPDHRIHALELLPQATPARLQVLEALVCGPVGEVAWRAALRLLVLAPERYEGLALALLDRGEGDGRALGFRDDLWETLERVARARLACSTGGAFVLPSAEHARPDVPDVLVGDFPGEGVEAIRALHERIWQWTDRGHHAHQADIARMAAIDHPLARALVLHYEQHGSLSPCCRASDLRHGPQLRQVARRALADAPLALLPAARSGAATLAADDDSHRMAVATLARLGEPSDLWVLTAYLTQIDAPGATAVLETLEAFEALVDRHPDAGWPPELRERVDELARAGREPRVRALADRLLARFEAAELDS